MPLCLGTVQLGVNYGIANKQGLPDMETAFQMLTSAEHCGYQWIDTAASYGRSEEIIGEYIKRHRATLKVVTKIPAFHAVETDEQAIAHILTSYEKSIQFLGHENIQCLLLHNEDDYRRYPHAVREAFLHIRNNSNVHYFGLSVYNPSMLLELNGDKLFNAFQLPFNIFDQRYADMSLILADSILLFVRSVFLQGLFFADAETLAAVHPDALLWMNTFRQFLSTYKLDASTACMGFVRHFLREQDCVVIGADCIEHIEKNAVLWAHCNLRMECITEARQIFRQIPYSLTDPRQWSMK